MGSEDISNGEDHEQKGFVFIGVSGEKGAAHEKVTGEAQDAVSVSQLYVMKERLQMSSSTTADCPAEEELIENIA